MASAIEETDTATAVRDRALDAMGRATQMAREARLLKTRATDAVEDGVHAAKRALTRGAHEFEDLRDGVAYRVKRAPLASLLFAAGAGALMGIAIGRCTRQPRRGGHAPA